jgi:hypothetical protein
MGTSTPDPRTTAPDEDYGAETLRRYRYQAAHAVFLGFGIFEPDSQIVCVYCEHHDDVLVELADGRCDAVQVKSRADDQGPLKANTDEVRGALQRWIGYEHAFGGRFRNYRLACNAGFWKNSKTVGNLPHCLEQACDCGHPEAMPVPLARLVGQLTLDAAIGKPTVIDALRRVKLDDDLPKLRDAEQRLRSLVSDLPVAAGQRASDIAAAVEGLVAIAMDASAQVEQTAASDYLAYLEDPDAHAAAQTIVAKRLTAERITQVLTAALQQATQFRSERGKSMAAMPWGSSRMEIKMDHGGIASSAVQLMKDFRTSAEVALTERLHRYGDEQTNRDYDHLSVLVRGAAEDARMASKREDRDWGEDMLLDLRARLRQRAAQGTDTLGLREEQLSGIASILTEECQVWWSEPFDLDAA